jgi:restriction endonuclease S subunit
LAEGSIVRELPKGWAETNLDKIAEIIMGQSPPGSSYNQTGEGFPLINGPVEFGPSPFSETVKSKFTIAPTKFCQKGDLIVCVRGSTTGRMNISGFEACIGRGVAAIRSHADQNYINLIIHSKQEEIYRLGTGSTFPNVSSDILGKIPIPLPPLNEQKRIADRLDLLLTRIDKTKAHLDRIPPLLKRFRQSVLAAATSGKLTEDWREANAKPEEFTDYFLANILDLDLGFAFKSAEFLDEGTRLLRGDNIEPGKLRWKDAKCLPSENLKDFAHLMLDKGDIVLAMDRPIISSGLKIARVGEDDVPSVLVQRVCRFRPHGVLDINYLYLVLSSSDFISHLAACRREA